MAITPGVNPDRSIPEDEQKPCKFCGKRMMIKNLSLSTGGMSCTLQGCPGQMISQ